MQIAKPDPVVFLLVLHRNTHTRAVGHAHTVGGLPAFTFCSYHLNISEKKNLPKLSLIFAASFVCHCMLLGLSAPPRFNGVTWSMT